MQLTSHVSARVIVLILTMIVSVFLLSQFSVVNSAMQQETKRSFENKIHPQVPLKIRIKKEKATYTFAFDEKNKDGWELLRAQKKRTDPMKLGSP